jgi:hypothetical protein
MMKAAARRIPTPRLKLSGGMATPFFPRIPCFRTCNFRKVREWRWDPTSESITNNGSKYSSDSAVSQDMSRDALNIYRISAYLLANKEILQEKLTLT